MAILKKRCKTRVQKVVFISIKEQAGGEGVGDECVKT